MDFKRKQKSNPISLIVKVLSLAWFLFYAGQAMAQHTHGPGLEKNYGIKLNKGKKWKVPPEMMKEIQELQSVILVFGADDERNHPELATKISSSLGRLTQNCTMKGQGHDELHKWLIPFIEKAEAYAASKDLTTQEIHYQYLKKSILVTSKYFR